MRIDVLTLFPEMFAGVLDASILKRAAVDVPDPAAPNDPERTRKAVASYHVHNLRDWSADDRHQKVDSPPYGGGPGMVIQCQPVWDAVQDVAALHPAPPRRILTTPQGQPLTQTLCETLAQEPRLLILAGHYEGLDQRVVDRLHEAGDGHADQGGLLEISVGDYVLSGGELPAMTIIDSVVRLLPGALGHADSAREDSFSPGVERLLDHPHYTRPAAWADRPVPEVLRSGDHAKIAAWRAEQSRLTTRQRRPDLLPAPPENTPENTPGSAPGNTSGNTAKDASVPVGGYGSVAAGSSPTPLIVLRDAGPADARALPPLHAAAFPTPAEADLVARLLDGHDVLFSLVAEQHRRPVGHALITAMTHEQGGSVRGLAALAPVAVHPDHQRQGIGTALVHEAVRQSREHRVAALFVLGDPRFYAPLGFIPAAEHGLTSAFGPAHAFQMIHLQPQRPLPPGRVHHAPEFVDLPA